MPLLEDKKSVNMHYGEITRSVKHREDELLIPQCGALRRANMHVSV